MYDVIIIGSGPAGLTAAIYASRAELKTLILTGPNLGGQLTTTSDVENFPGFPEGILGPELMDKMIKQATRFRAELKMETVKKTSFGQRPFIIETDKGSYEAKTVIVATGATHRRLGLESEQRLWGRGISACATCDGFLFKGREVAVVGGGDAAMEEAIFLSRFASKITVIHRSEAFRASKIMLRRARENSKISFLVNSEVIEVLGEERVSGIRVKNNKTGEVAELKIEGLFLAIGYKPNSDLYRGQLELNEKGYVLVHDSTRTSVEGVFSAGDVGDYRYRQAVSAAGAGCMAAMDAEKFLAEEKK